MCSERMAITVWGHRTDASTLIIIAGRAGARLADAAAPPAGNRTG